MNHGSLFSGFGGFDLAAQWMGWNNLFHCEKEKFCQQVLNYYWPNAELFDDIKTADFSKYYGTVDVISGGFPCQPYSSAGKRLGKHDDRHLWPYMLEAIRAIQPRWVVGENVHGLITWNSGLVLHEVQADLETEGYQAFPYVLPASAVDAPHRRDRVFIVAFKDTNGNGRTRNIRQGQPDERGQRDSCTGDNERVSANDAEVGPTANTNSDGQFRGIGQDEIHAGEGRVNALRHAFHGAGHGNAPNATGEGREDGQQVGGRANTAEVGRGLDIQPERFRQHGLATNSGSAELQRGQQHRGAGEERETEGQGRQSVRPISSAWAQFPTQSPICGRNDGLPTKLDGITFSKWRKESLKGYGNAVVPQVVMQIFKAIEQYEIQHGNI